MKNKRNIIISIIILITIILGAIVLYIYCKDKDIPNEN